MLKNADRAGRRHDDRRGQADETCGDYDDEEGDEHVLWST
jgi:hypothetical protein